MTPETLVQFAEARGRRLGAERAAELVASVEGLLNFVRELDEVITPEVVPVFLLDD